MIYFEIDPLRFIWLFHDKNYMINLTLCDLIQVTQKLYDKPDFMWPNTSYTKIIRCYIRYQESQISEDTMMLNRLFSRIIGFQQFLC